MYAYPERVCLIQISTEQTDAIVDPLQKNLDIKPLLSVLSKHLLIMHGAEYDLRLLYRWYRFRPHEVFDTMLAAKLLGEESCGLGNLCEKYMGVHLIKKHQKADWGKRPLPKELLNYAIKDAFYLPELKRRLEQLLIACGRLEWHHQNCQRLIRDCTVPIKPEPTREWRLGGCEFFSRRELCFLRALWYWRENEGILHNRPLYFIMRPDLLLKIAKLAAAGKEYTRFLPRLSSGTRNRFLHVLQETEQIPPRKYPMRLHHAHQRFTLYQQRQLEYITKLRDTKAHELNMEPMLIASRPDLVGFVRDPNSCHLTPWQKGLLGVEIKDNKLFLPQLDKSKAILSKI